MAPAAIGDVVDDEVGLLARRDDPLALLCRLALFDVAAVGPCPSADHLRVLVESLSRFGKEDFRDWRVVPSRSQDPYVHNQFALPSHKGLEFRPVLFI